MKTNISFITPVAVLCLGAGMAWADSISPSVVVGTLDVGESMTVKKTVTITKEATGSKVDVFFLADTTGSMGGYLAAVKNSASSILSGTTGLGDVAWGVGDYRDVPRSPWGEPSDYTYNLQQPITTVASAAQTAIGTWTAGGGNDWPESQLIALREVAGAPTGWRAGSERIVVWFGDAPGHEPSDTAGYPGPSRAQTITALQAAGCQVLALNVGFGELDLTGQATAITAATGGTLYNGINVDTIVDKIEEAINTAVSTYTKVDLEPSGVPAGVTVAVSPAAGYTGTYDRSIERTFAFDVTITGVTPGSYDFDVWARVDGGRVALERDSISVEGGDDDVPDAGSSMLLLGLAAIGLGMARRKTA